MGTAPLSGLLALFCAAPAAEVAAEPGGVSWVFIADKGEIYLAEELARLE